MSYKFLLYTFTDSNAKLLLLSKYHNDSCILHPLDMKVNIVSKLHFVSMLSIKGKQITIETVHPGAHFYVSCVLLLLADRSCCCCAEALETERTRTSVSGRPPLAPFASTRTPAPPAAFSWPFSPSSDASGSRLERGSQRVNYLQVIDVLYATRNKSSLCDSFS